MEDGELVVSGGTATTNPLTTWGINAIFIPSELRGQGRGAAAGGTAAAAVQSRQGGGAYECRQRAGQQAFSALCACGPRPAAGPAPQSPP